MTMPADPFDPRRRATVAALCRILLPETGTPGGIEAGVPAFIESLVTTWCTPSERRFFLAGLDDFNAEAVQRYKIDFAECSEGQQKLLVRQAETASERGDNALVDPAERKRLSFFGQFKDFAVNGFFASETGCTRVLRHLPRPGRYDGDWAIYEQVPQWSSLNGY